MSQITGMELKGSRLISSRLSDQPPYITPRDMGSRKISFG